MSGNGADDTVYIHRLLYVAEHGLDALPPNFQVHHRDSIPSLNVLFDDWRDTEAVIEICRCGGFEVRQVVFERGEIRFDEAEA